jgi:hypothetical protein
VEDRDQQDIVPYLWNAKHNYTTMITYGMPNTSKKAKPEYRECTTIMNKEEIPNVKEPE